MDVLDLSRWQFGITTVYHFLFVPLTIGLAPIVAIFQTAWVRTGHEKWLRLTKFFGKLLLINFALGVATGIVQEFQFGMNWSEYSRFVGDVFGAPLALEGLVAFFLESTFLGLWMFGWDRLPKKVHLTAIWLFAVGVNASAYFIIAANSFMQHPVGATYNAEKGRAELTSIWALLTNNTALAAFPHVITGALLVAASFVAGIAGFHMVRNMQRIKALESGDAASIAALPAPLRGDADRPGIIARLRRDATQVYRAGSFVAIVVMFVSGIGLAISGDAQAKLMFEQQPIKMASAEALCETYPDGAPFSVLSVGTLNSCEGITHAIEIPGLTSFLATNSFTSELKGIPDLQTEYTAKYGEMNYKPNLFVTYWSFRMMIGLSAGSILLALAGWWVTRKGRTPDQTWYKWLALIAIPFPFFANSAGWVFTEMGRQPWLVAPNPTGDPRIRLDTAAGVSQHGWEVVAFTLVGFTVLYFLLFLVWFNLQRRYAEHGLEPAKEDAPASKTSEKPDHLSFAY
ncbi:cytochrome ubiquinol oxidase subunit I [Micrococcales bacterium 31B]|nr:cytochrome ubiquinol oxidase subunit I [Micrococcales bacterium 31B]